MLLSSPNNPPVQPPQTLEESDDGSYNRFDSSLIYYKNSPLLKLSPNFPLPGSEAASWIYPPQLFGMPSTSECKGERKCFLNMPGYYTSGMVKDPAPATRSLPDDVITEILLRLPVRDIMRFRCVCKLWCSIMQDHSFISRHLHERPYPNDLGIVSLSCQPAVHELSVLYSVNGFRRFDMTSLFRDEFYKMSNSCNGLVCVYGGQTTYVVNPIIREVLVLPVTRYGAQASIALGQDTSTGEYKVVRLFHLRGGHTRCQIINLGSHSWRDVQGVPSTLASSSILYKLKPVVVNGAVHWLTDSGYEADGVVIAFDIKDENFYVIKIPLEIRIQRAVLVDWDGHLCLSVTPLPEEKLTPQFRYEWVVPNYKDIWLLEDYGNHRWKRHRISMQLIEDPNVASKANPLVVHDGRVLWQSGYQFHFYDMKSGRFMRPSLHVARGFVCAQACAYKDTFVSPIAIQAKEYGKRITGTRMALSGNRRVWRSTETCFYS